MNKTLANINIDAMYPWGPTRDVIVIGSGNTTLEDILAEEAKTDGRTITPDMEPEKGRFYRSDHFELGKVGVPALYRRPATSSSASPRTSAPRCARCTTPLTTTSRPTR